MDSRQQPSPARSRSATVAPRHDGERLGRYLRRVTQLGRREVLELVDRGRVTIAGTVARGVERPVVAGEHVEWRGLGAPGIAGLTRADFLFDDPRLVAVAKPPGLPAMCTPAGEHGIAELAVRFLGRDALWVVHRLDRGTSGVMVLAGDRATAADLAGQFAARSVCKTYVALVDGLLRPDQGEVDAALEAAGTHSGRSRVAAAGRGPSVRPALSRYRVIERRAGTTLVELEPHTGRRHQLRAHLAHLGHPIVGDVGYGGPPAARMFLHALRLRLDFAGQALCLDAPPVLELRRVGGAGEVDPRRHVDDEGVGEVGRNEG